MHTAHGHGHGHGTWRTADSRQQTAHSTQHTAHIHMQMQMHACIGTEYSTRLGQPQARDVGLGVEGRVVHGEKRAHAHLLRVRDRDRVRVRVSLP